MLLLAAVLVLGVSAFMVSALNQTPDPATLNRNYNARVLQQAKDALIGYVVKEVLDLTENVPGRLPCPESPGDAGGDLEGRAASTCDPTFATNKNVGRLPWRTLALDKLVDAANEPLWYAVSPNWVLGSATPVINSGTPGQLTVDGISNVVAVIIAPGRPLSVNPNASQIAAGCTARNQVRFDKSHNPGAPSNPNYLDYLECQNGSAPIDLAFGGSVVDNPTHRVVNDQLVIITAEEILNAIQGPIVERMQRTVAPLLSEFGDIWAAGSKRLPYAVPFTAPEALPADGFCGPTANVAQQLEGLLPIAPSAGSCSSNWTGGFTGSGITSNGCVSSGTNALCSFTYYRLNSSNFLFALLGLSGVANVTATLQAVAPHATASFRLPLQPTSIAATPAAPTTTISGVSFLPGTDGDAQLSLNVQVSAANICLDGLLPVIPLIGKVTCQLLVALVPGLASAHDVALTIPQLAAPILQGSKLSAGVLSAHTPSSATPPYAFDLLNPAGPGPANTPPAEPHYWFIQNQWYRYTYYAVAPNATVAASGGDLTVNGFPVANGNANDKQFVLALMGPPVTGQVRPSAAVNQYVEGANAVTGASPRAFAYQVYAVAGNDRLATCPFTDGLAPCD